MATLYSGAAASKEIPFLDQRLLLVVYGRLLIDIHDHTDTDGTS